MSDELKRSSSKQDRTGDLYSLDRRAGVGKHTQAFAVMDKPFVTRRRICHTRARSHEQANPDTERHLQGSYPEVNQRPIVCFEVQGTRICGERVALRQSKGYKPTEPKAVPVSDVRDLERKETFHTLIAQLHTQRLVGISIKNVPPSN